MPRLVALNRQNWNAGTYESGELAVPLGASKVRVEFERNSWPTLPGTPPESRVIEVTAEISLDGGQTWQLLIAATTEGGDRYSHETGQLHTHSWMQTNLPEPDNPNRVGRVRMVVNVALNTQIELDVT